MATTLQCGHGSKNGAKTDDIMRPLKDIKKAIYYSLNSQIKNRSANGRTYFSRYHSVGKNLKLSAHKQKERGQVAITILGDRRPYKVVVLYKIDSLNGGKFKFSRYDKGLAIHYLEKVNTYLTARPEERDVIDDFRPY